MQNTNHTTSFLVIAAVFSSLIFTGTASADDKRLAETFDWQTRMQANLTKKIEQQAEQITQQAFDQFQADVHEKMEQQASAAIADHQIARGSNQLVSNNTNIECDEKKSAVKKT